MEKNISFGGLIPENYEKYLGPFLFEPYGLDIKERVASGNYESVVELACGTGRVTKYLREALPDSSRLTATDINPDMLSLAREKVPHEKIEWKQADMQEIPFSDSLFDLAVSQFGIMFVPDKTKAYKEIYRILKPGGKLLFSSWDRFENNSFFTDMNMILEKYMKDIPVPFHRMPFSYFDNEEIKNHLKEAGFKNIKISVLEKDGIITKAEHAAKGITNGTPLYTAMMEMDPDLLGKVENELTEMMKKNYGTDPMKCRLRAIIIEAEK